MKQQILVVDNYDSFTYNLVHYIEMLGAIPTVIENDKISSSTPEKYDKIIISPGPGLPLSAGKTCQVIEQYAGRKPILGVCLGMQAIAEVFGYQLKNLNKLYHGEATDIQVCDSRDKLYQDCPSQFLAARYHSWVVDIPANSINFSITAKTVSGEIMSISHKTLPLYGVQYHPESVLTKHGIKILSNFLTI